MSWVEFTVSIFTAVMASTGFWAGVSRFFSKKDAVTRAIKGLLYERILIKGESYIKRGSITVDEYNDFFKYFYDPYHDLDGDGTCERIANAVKNLPIV